MKYERRGRVILVNIPSRPLPPVREPDGGLASRLSFEEIREGCEDFWGREENKQMFIEAMQQPRPYD